MVTLAATSYIEKLRHEKQTVFPDHTHLLFLKQRCFHAYLISTGRASTATRRYFNHSCSLGSWSSNSVFCGIFYAPKSHCPSVLLCVRCISPIFFEVGIPNLVCGCILGLRSVTYHFRDTVTLTLTSDLVFIVIKRLSVRPSRFVSGAYLLHSLR